MPASPLQKSRSQKTWGLGFGFHCRSVADPLTHGGLPACRPPPHPPHLVGLPLFSSSSSAIVTTGAPEPACDSIEMPDGACNARSPWGMVRRSHCLEPTWILPASTSHFPLDRRRSVCSLAFRWRRGGCRQARGVGARPVPDSPHTMTDGLRSTASLAVRSHTRCPLHV